MKKTILLGTMVFLVGHANAIAGPLCKEILSGNFKSYTILPDGRLKSTSINTHDSTLIDVGLTQLLSDREGAGLTLLLLPHQVLVTGGHNGISSNIVKMYDDRTGELKPIGRMKAARAYHSQGLMPTGQVLVAGGADGHLLEAIKSIELIDLITGVSTPVAELKDARAYHTQSLLPNGDVLFLGGSDRRMLVSTIERYQSNHRRVDRIGLLNQPRREHAATTLLDGRVMVSGGRGENGALASIEVIDPISGKSKIIGHLKQARVGHTQELTIDGRILVEGGTFNGRPVKSSELIDPRTGESTPIENKVEIKNLRTQRALPESFKESIQGKFLNEPQLEEKLPAPITGTQSIAKVEKKVSLPLSEILKDVQGSGLSPLNSNETLIVGGSQYGKKSDLIQLYNTETGVVETIGKMQTARSYHTQGLTPQHLLIVAGGGDDAFGALDTIEILTAFTGKHVETLYMKERRSNHTQSMINEGDALFVGGKSYKGYLSSIERLSDGGEFGRKVYRIGDLNVARGDHAATLLPNKKVLVSGGRNERGSLDSIELIDPSTGQTEIIGHLLQPRANHTQSLTADGRVLVEGGSFQGMPVKDAELIDPTTGKVEQIKDKADVERIKQGLPAQFKNDIQKRFEAKETQLEEKLPGPITTQLSAGRRAFEPSDLQKSRLNDGREMPLERMTVTPYSPGMQSDLRLLIQLRADLELAIATNNNKSFLLRMLNKYRNDKNAFSQLNQISESRLDSMIDSKIQELQTITRLSDDRIVVQRKDQTPNMFKYGGGYIASGAVLSDGKLIFIGHTSIKQGRPGYSIEVVDPKTGEAKLIGETKIFRRSPMLTVLPNNKVRVDSYEIRDEDQDGKPLPSEIIDLTTGESTLSSL